MITADNKVRGFTFIVGLYYNQYAEHGVVNKSAEYEHPASIRLNGQHKRRIAPASETDDCNR
jgi:hypothetical protein